MEQRASHQTSETFMQAASLFQEGLSYAKLASLYSKGARVTITKLTEEFSFDAYRKEHGANLTLLFVVSPSDVVYPAGGAESVAPKADWHMVSLVQKKAPGPAAEAGTKKEP